MIPTYVKKRDGRVEDFEEDNIRTNMKRALEASNTEYPESLLYDLLEVRYLFNYKKNTISVEELSDLVETTFMREGLYDAARAYITYRFQRKLFREKKDVVSKIVDEYVDKKTWRVNENSNVTYSYPAMQSMIAGNIISNYTLNSIYPSNIAEAHLCGDIHIHDLSMGTAPYCAGWSLRNLLLDGFGGVEGKISSKPPAHLSSAIDQMINFLGVLQNEFSGAQAFNSIDTFLAPYVRLDNLTLFDVKKCIENFVFGVNVGSRWGQSVFSNVTFDWKCPKDLENDPVIVRGKEVGFTYGDCQKEMDMINEAFWSIMSEGDANQMPFTFPIPTVNVTKDFDYDTPAAKLMLETAAKFGLPYFQNFINSGLNPSDVRSLCCRLQLSIADLRKHTGGIFGAGDSTGSIGVVTINLARLGYLSNSDEDFFSRLDTLLDLSKESLVLKRKVININLERGLFPYTKRYLGSFKNYFSTVGVVGGTECCENFLRKGIETQEGKEFMLAVLQRCRKKTETFTEETGDLFNLEASPAEGASYRLATLDQKYYSDMILSGDDVKYLTNSTQLPVNYTEDLFEALDHQDELQCSYTSGCLEKGNAIITDKGSIKIEDLVKNFNLLSPIKTISYNTKTNEAGWDLITNAISVDVSKKNKVRIVGEKGLNIVTSDWHPFFVLEKLDYSPVTTCPACSRMFGNKHGLDIHVRKCKEGREALKTRPKYRVVQKRADELQQHDYILQNSSNVLPDTPCRLSNDVAWLLGFFIADGSLYLRKNRYGEIGYTVGFFDETLENLEKTKRILKDIFDISVNIRSESNYYKGRKGSLTTIHFSRKKDHPVIQLLFRYGFIPGTKCYTVAFSNTLRTDLNKKNAYHFLAGLIDGDGWVSKQGDIGFCTTSKQLGIDVSWLCSVMGIPSRLSEYHPKKENEHTTYTVTILGTTISLMKESFPLESKHKVARIYDTRYVRNKITRALPVVRVKYTSKVNVEDNQFYDLTVKKNQNYLAGNQTTVFVHNSVFHAFTGEQLTADGVRLLIQKICSTYKLPYFSMTPTFSICPDHKYFSGEHKECPTCGKECLVFTRVVGYYRGVSSFNKGKKEEVSHRKMFKL